MPAFISRSPIGIVAAISIALLFGATALQAGKTRISTTPAVHATSTAQNSVPSLYIESDADKDGLPDWQETLIGTDPHNPDSDNDGTKDVYTPLSSAFGTTSTATTSLETRLASRVLNELVSEYVFLKQYDLYTEDRGEQIGQRLSYELYTTVDEDAYTTDDVRIFQDTSYDAVLAYRSELRSALAPLLENTISEFVLYGYALEGDSAALTELGIVADRYAQAAQNTMAVQAPPDAVVMHLGVANTLAHFGNILVHMKEAINDPLASYALLREYNTAERELYNAFNAQAAYFSTKHTAHITYENE